MTTLLEANTLQLLHTLLDDGRPKPAAVLASRLEQNIDDISRAADQLATLGCVLDSHPQAGIRLISASMNCWSEYLEWRHGDALARRVYVFGQTSSTQDVARQLVGKDPQAARDAVVLADHQSAGRGRLGARWVGEPGACVLMTVSMGSTQASIDRITLAAGLAVVRAVETLGAASVQLHWPNDVYVDGRKLAGVLVERAETATLIGIGLNHRFDNAPPDVDAPRPPIDLHTLGIEHDRLRVIDALLAELQRTLHVLDDAALLSQWCERAGQIQRRVTAISDGKRLTGRVIDIDPARGLVVELQRGPTVFLPAATTRLLDSVDP